MALIPGAAARALFGHRPFLFYFVARAFSEFSFQITAVAVGWQVYALTNSAFDIGMVGLVQFVPMVLLTFAAGHVADRYDRRRVAQVCQLASGAAGAFLAWGTLAGWLTVTQIFVAAAVLGATSAFESPAVAALLPGVVRAGELQKASAVSTGAIQLATISGPALGGLAYALGPFLPYAIVAVFWLLAALLNNLIGVHISSTAGERPSFAALFAGVGFVRRNPPILGSISLELFAVMLGGATALLPIYARDILNTGPWGLGILRGAPAVGALAMSAYLAHHTIESRAGMRMFQAVIIFGLATIVFAISRSLAWSIVALIVLGAADMVSMVIRISLVQLATPDEMRGRVSAVNFLFINSSSQLGEFESGVTAALFGAMPAALLGGIGTIVVALLWMKLFPDLRRVEKLDERARLT
jgi:MFS family permease